MELLAQAGYPNGFTFSVWTSGQFVNSLAVAQVLQQQLAKAHITLKIHDEEFGLLIKDVISGNYESMIHDTDGKPTTSNAYWVFSSICHLPACFGDIPRENDSVIDSITNQLINAPSNSSALQQQLNNQLQSRVLQEGYMVHLYYLQLLQGFTSNVKGYVPLNTAVLTYNGNGGFYIYRPSLGLVVTVVSK